MARSDWPAKIMAHATENATYATGKPRWDVIVECMTLSEIAEEFCEDAKSYREALAAAKAHITIYGEVDAEHQAEARAGCPDYDRRSAPRVIDNHDPARGSWMDTADTGWRADEDAAYERECYRADMLDALRAECELEAETLPKRTPGCSCDDHQLIFVGCDCGIEEGRPPNLHAFGRQVPTYGTGDDLPW